MVFGILAATVAVPAVIGTTEAVRQGQRQNRQEEHRGRKSELVVSVSPGSKQSKRREELDGAFVVLWRNRLWIQPQTSTPTPLDNAHPFNGYFLKHPHQHRWRAAGFDPHGEGLVSTISHEPPVLNWVYVDPKTHQMRYGTRAEVDEAEGMAGPWDVSAGIGTDKGTGLLGGGRRLTFQGWEGFVVVEEEVHLENIEQKSEQASSTAPQDDQNDKAEGRQSEAQKKVDDKSGQDSEGSEEEDEQDDDQTDLWASAEEQLQHTTEPTTAKLWGLYFDVKDDGLSSEDRIGKQYWKHDMLEVELTRRERRRTRESAIEERVDRLRQRKKVDEKNESMKTEMTQTTKQAGDDPGHASKTETTDESHSQHGDDSGQSENRSKPIDFSSKN